MSNNDVKIRTCCIHYIMEVTYYDTINFSYVIQLGDKEMTMLDEHNSKKYMCVWKWIYTCLGHPNCIFCNKLLMKSWVGSSDLLENDLMIDTMIISLSSYMITCLRMSQSKEFISSKHDLDSSEESNVWRTQIKKNQRVRNWHALMMTNANDQYRALQIIFSLVIPCLNFIRDDCHVHVNFFFICT